MRSQRVEEDRAVSKQRSMNILVLVFHRHLSPAVQHSFWSSLVCYSSNEKQLSGDSYV